MKQFRNLTMTLMMTGFCFIIGACSDDDFIEQEQMQSADELATHTIPMEFIGEVVGFDQLSNQAGIQTRATTSSSWSNGDKIYITFYNGSTIVPGEASYNSSSGWSVSYDGNLATGTNLKCEARYFVNATFSSSSLVSLNSNSEIYEDLNGTYAYSNGSLTVQATLSPKTGRIRFTGASGAKIYTTGISVYTTFSPAINTFSSSNAMITSTVASSGSTPYIYGVFSDAERNIGLVGSDFAYTRTCTSDMLKTGESGYMAIPSESAHNNWRSGLYVKASGVEFKMIPVAGYPEGFFMIAETEVTRALYHAVTSGSATTSILPVQMGYSEIEGFITKLNYSTNLSFEIPTLDQWRYAAKGGSKTQNYTYSGSNTPGDVAWYAGNSGGESHDVKQLSPNELGIYDMSGNVEEWTTTPIQSSSYYAGGGAYFDTENKITTNSARFPSGVHTAGIRIILTCQ